MEVVRRSYHELEEMSLEEMSWCTNPTCNKFEIHTMFDVAPCNLGGDETSIATCLTAPMKSASFTASTPCNEGNA
jgi:hypothetical protein